MKYLLRDGEVGVLRTCAEDGSSHNGFRWPLEVGAEVVAPDWDPTPECGHGLHGLLRGAGSGNLLCWDTGAKWLVLAVPAAECVDLTGKVKFPRARVVHVGDRSSASALLREWYPDEAVTGASVTGGDRATVTGGDRASVTGGDGASVTGGNHATVTGGDYATVTGGNYATVCVQWWDGKSSRRRIAVGYVGEDGMEAGVPYCVVDGKLVRKEVAK